MTRIAFLTLFLGLTVSHQKVALTVNGPAQRVELQLDGNIVATLAREPWSTTIDFGALAPHILLARALSDDGREVARAEQKINLPRSSAETQIVLDRNSNGTPRAARVVWQSIEGERPASVELLLDSRAIPIGSDLRAELPALDLARPHLLRARFTSRLGVASESELAFGGGLEDATSAELTPVAMRLRNPQQEIGETDAQQWLTARGLPAMVVAIERMAPEVFVVRHPVATEASVRLASMVRIAARRSPPIALTRFVWPVATRTGRADLVPSSQSFGFTTAADFKELLSDITFPSAPSEVRYADAVAGAAIHALAARRPRAIVLLLGENPSEASRLDPREVREFLKKSGVPLHVWSLAANPRAERWGDARDVSTPHGYADAFEALMSDVESQRIVWVRGDFLPGAVHVNNMGGQLIALLSK